ncbi:hypothetical protein CCMSSC00406_0005269 [Pleurotus cornucopiae]|uniref:Uncharacterized protein n=1 Tax=Pleurotus cornucopiae TaxID=5321 RepID=A0ACB7IJL1_PLECO|nr:hypothetical protein CCMSSC00406_0005269 [Pleurotus cornucopiae]
MNPNIIVRDSYQHLREEEEESSESSSAEVEIFDAVSEAISFVPSIHILSINKHTSRANIDTISVMSKTYNMEVTNDSEQINPHRSVCLEVFRNTWVEFYEWEKEYCEAKLAALMSERRKGASATPTITATATTARPTSPPGPIWVIPCPQTTVDLSGVLADFDAAPLYESCTPLNGNVYVGDDPDVMPFLPFGEEDWDGSPLPGGLRKRFSFEDYIGEYGQLAWMSEFDDPDLDCILYATTQRLASMSISYAQMDAISVFARTPRLPLLSVSSGDHPGLEARAAKRDFPPFPTLPSTPTPRPSAPSVLSTLKTQIYPLFCHNLTCIRHICPTHSEDTPYPHATAPRRKSAQLANDDPTPDLCSPTCYRRRRGLHTEISGTIPMSSSSSSVVSAPAERGRRGITGPSQPAMPDSWSAVDRDTLITLLELDADAQSCDLAILMKKSCNDALVSTPDPAMTPALACAPTYSASVPSARGATANLSGVPKGATRVAVPKESAAAQNSVPADVPTVHAIQSNVLGVPLRILKHRRVSIWLLYGQQLVDVVKLLKFDDQHMDMAFSSKRVCSLMNSSWVRPHASPLCAVFSSQLSIICLDVLSPYLLNCFVLSEYTGEAILDPTCISRDYIIAHRQRNYLFALNTTLGVDSSLAGDPSRFINHGNPPDLVDGYVGAGDGIANVYSHVEITNGGHGVVLYAAIDMDAGTELLLDYGPKFFKQVHGGDDDGDKGENEEEKEERQIALKYKGYWDDDPEYGEAEEYKE